MSPRVIVVYGVPATGKTSTSQALLPHLCPSEAQSTDNLNCLYAHLNPTDLLNGATSYTAYQHLGLGPSALIEGFDRYRNRLTPYLSCLFSRATRECFTLIVDGIHFSPTMPSGGCRVLPILLTVSDRATHEARVTEKAGGRHELRDRLLANLTTIRLIQDHITREAVNAGTHAFDTGRQSIEEVVHAILARTNS